MGIRDHPTAARSPQADQYPLASEKVRFVGEAVAVVMADTLEQARDAAEFVEIDYEVLPATFSSLDALAKDVPKLWADAPGNECFHLHFGDAAATDKAFTEAAYIIEHVFDSQQIVTCQMESGAAYVALPSCPPGMFL